MNLLELFEFNINLFLINNAGLTDINSSGANILELLSNDPLLIKFHRKMYKKYGKVVSTYMITKSKNYYILDPKFSKKILNDSPTLFSAGKLKEKFFKQFMPKNVGISKCQKNKCPWKNRRDFNENALGTRKNIYLFKCMPNIIARHITKPLLNIDDFKNVSYKIISDLIYGESGVNSIRLKTFMNNLNDKLLKSQFYKEYKNHLQKSYKTNNRCCLLYYANMFKNDNINVIDDQIPHWFAPLFFMCHFLIPNLLCVILNYNNVLNKLNKELSNESFNIHSKHTYLHYCVIEHIRLFSTININIQRTVNKNMIYEGLYFKEGEQIFILLSSILRDEKMFDNPDNFIPERWYGKTIEQQDIVFGVGPQQCPSKRITPIFYKEIIYYLLKNYKYTSAKPILKSRELHFINPFKIKLEI